MHLRRRASGIVTIDVGPSLERQAPEVIRIGKVIGRSSVKTLSHIEEVGRQEIASGLDDRGSVSRSRVTISQFLEKTGLFQAYFPFGSLP